MKTLLVCKKYNAVDESDVQIVIVLLEQTLQCAFGSGIVSALNPLDHQYAILTNRLAHEHSGAARHKVRRQRKQRLSCLRIKFDSTARPTTAHKQSIIFVRGIKFMVHQWQQ